MSQPPPYTPVTSFITYQAQQAWFPGQNLDVEFNSIRISIAGIEKNLTFIQNDDLTLGHGTVGWDQLAPAFQAQLRQQGFTGAPASGANSWFGLQTFLSGVQIQWPNLAGLYTAGTAGSLLFKFTDNNIYFDNYDTQTFTFRGTSFASLFSIGPNGFTAANVNPRTGTFGSSQVFHSIGIPADELNVGSNTVTGLQIAHTFGTSVAQGNRLGVDIILEQSSPSNGSNPGRGYTALQTQMISIAGDGGSGISQAGSYWAIGAITQLQAGATNLVEASVAEFNTNFLAGSSTLDKYGYKIVQFATDAVQGSRNDAAFFAGNQTGAVGWLAILQVGNGLGGGFAAPLAAAGSVILIKGAQTFTNIIAASGTAPTITDGIDLTGFTISSKAFKTTGFSISGTGVLTALDGGTWGAGGISVVANIGIGNAQAYLWSTRSVIFSPADGVIEFTNNAQTGFGRLQLGGTTSSFPSLKRSLATIVVRLADDSADAALSASVLSASAATAASSTATGSGIFAGGIGVAGTSFIGPLIATAAAGLQVGAPTGGDKGAGTLNLAGDLFIVGTQVVGPRATGWTVATGTPSRATFTTGGVTLSTLAGVVMALEQDLIAHGLIGT